MDLNPGSTDDLAAFALDALETSELKAVEARLDGQRPLPELDAWRQTLGEVATLAAEEPPSSLRDRALSSATAASTLRQRAAPAGGPARQRGLHQDGRRARSAALGAQPGGLGRSDHRGLDGEGPRHPPGRQSSSTSGVSSGCGRCEIDEALEADHLGMTRAFVAAWSDRPVRRGAGPLAGARPGRSRATCEASTGPPAGSRSASTSWRRRSRPS